MGDTKTTKEIMATVTAMDSHSNHEHRTVTHAICKRLDTIEKSLASGVHWHKADGNGELSHMTRAAKVDVGDFPTLGAAVDMGFHAPEEKPSKEPTTMGPLPDAPEPNPHSQRWQEHARDLRRIAEERRVRLVQEKTRADGNFSENTRLRALLAAAISDYNDVLGRMKDVLKERDGLRVQNDQGAELLTAEFLARQDAQERVRVLEGLRARCGVCGELADVIVEHPTRGPEPFCNEDALIQVEIDATPPDSELFDPVEGLPPDTEPTEEQCEHGCDEESEITPNPLCPRHGEPTPSQEGVD